MYAINSPSNYAREYKSLASTTTRNESETKWHFRCATTSNFRCGFVSRNQSETKLTAPQQESPMNWALVPPFRETRRPQGHIPCVTIGVAVPFRRFAYFFYKGPHIRNEPLPANDAAASALPNLKLGKIVQHMTSTDVAALKRPPIQGASKPGQVTGKLAIAITAMVENGTPWDEAARQAGLTTRSMRLSLQKPHVLAYLRQRRYVLAETICAGNPQRLAEIRDSDRNLAASVRAVSELEQMAGNPSARGGTGSVPTQPGMTIVIVNTRDAVKVGPTIEHEPDRRDDDE
jgi:hypothetical protein